MAELKIVDTAVGDGAEVKAGDKVRVHYTGRLINGRVFDDSRRDGIPAAFRLFEVIEGWQIALSQMRPGDRWTIYLPANMAYGSRTDGDIPGNSTLIFDVELLSIA